MDPNTPDSYRDALDRHRSLLEQHQQFLLSLQPQSSAVPGKSEVLRQCLQDVDAMMAHVKKAGDTFGPSNIAGASSTSQNSARIGRPMKSLPKGHRVNPGGRPTPQEELRGRYQTSTVIRVKRSYDEDDQSAVHSTENELSRGRPSQKKPRMEESDTLHDERSETAGDDSRETNNEPEQQPVETTSYEEAFAREVEEALRIKELKKLKRLDKKRKRQSATSDVSMSDVVQQSSEKPQRKRQKSGQSESEAEASESISQSTARSGETTPRSEKGNNKRSSPAAEYIGSVLQQVEERVRVKRQRMVEV